MHISGAQDFFREDGYVLRRIGPRKWAYIDTEDESGEEKIAAEGDSPAAAARALFEARYSHL